MEKEAPESQMSGRPVAGRHRQRDLQPVPASGAMIPRRVSPLPAAYRTELAAADAASIAADFDAAFHHLERAHILGQRRTRAHVKAHWLMLRLGASVGDWREVAGQALRIVAAALFSRIWVPLGNTGRARVGAMKPMPLPGDLRQLLEEGGTSPWH